MYEKKTCVMNIRGLAFKFNVFMQLDVYFTFFTNTLSKMAIWIFGIW